MKIEINYKIIKQIPSLRAHLCILSDPNTVIISAKAVQSSGDRKKGCEQLRMDINITPLAQISIAEIKINF